jgi:5-methylcytosine-specific restriction endonuclease McrA
MAGMNTRRKLSKQERMTVYSKTNGHCAYCGISLELKDMQVDHVIPINGWKISGPDTLDNMFPACRSCNHYKSRSDLETFRKMLEDQPHVLSRDSVTYQIAVRYGLVKPDPHPIMFYFEKLKAGDH